MSLTGLFLVSFLLVHLSGNLQLFYNDGGVAFNTYTKFMTTNPVIKVAEYILAAGFLFHIVYAFILTMQNNKARPQQYAVKNNKSSSWASRNMMLLGAVLLLFLVSHVAMFWGKYHFGAGETVTAKAAYEGVFKLTAPVQLGNVTIKAGHYIMDEDWAAASSFYTATAPATAAVEIANMSATKVQAISMMAVVVEAFKNPLIVAFYLLSMAFLAFHLMHGFQSAFQTIGLTHKKYTPIVKTIGFVIGVVFPLVFAAMPVFLFLKG